MREIYAVKTYKEPHRNHPFTNDFITLVSEAVDKGSVDDLTRFKTTHFCSINIGALCGAYRVITGKTQKEISEKSWLKKSWLSRFENGRIEHTYPDYIFKYISVLGMPLYLLELVIIGV